MRSPYDDLLAAAKATGYNVAMVSPDLKPRWTFAVLAVCMLAVFAALLFGLTVTLRARLRQEIRQGEAQAIHDVAIMQVAQTERRLTGLHVDVTSSGIFAAVLESSLLHGVLAVQLFDATGALREALPDIASDTSKVNVWWSATLTTPDARFYPRGRLEQILGLPADAGSGADTTPLLEVIVPLHDTTGRTSFGVARYWIDGTPLQTEYRHLDRSLAGQAGIAFVGGSVLIGLLLAWSYRRLSQANQHLLQKSADLAEANRELDFAAKTGALGAISAHLIHGLKNPLAGLEGFVNDAANTGDTAALGEARQTAMETTRRLRAMVNEVITVLRDETTGSAEYRVPVSETLEAVKGRAEPIARANGIELVVDPAPAVQLVARTANLASLVLANLLTNAIEASLRESEVRLETKVADGRIEFCVVDHGPGLPQAVRASLFRPVASTKAGGGGMGLAISLRLARHAGGELSLLSSNAAGTVFRLSVPPAPSS